MCVNVCDCVCVCVADVKQIGAARTFAALTVCVLVHFKPAAAAAAVIPPPTSALPHHHHHHHYRQRWHYVYDLLQSFETSSGRHT